MVLQLALLVAIARVDLLRMRVYPLHLLLLGATALLGVATTGNPTPGSAMAGAVCGGGAFALVWAGGRAYGRMTGAPEGTVVFGRGDVYLMTVCGLLLGFPAVLIALALTIALGGMGALAVLACLVGRGAYDRRSSRMPYAVFVVAGCLIALLARV